MLVTVIGAVFWINLLLRLLVLLDLVLSVLAFLLAPPGNCIMVVYVIASYLKSTSPS